MTLLGRRKILITGGLGFIGSHLIDAIEYSQTGEDIIVVDNMESNAIGLHSVAGRCYTFVQSIEDFNFDNVDFDIVYHLASPVGPVGVLKHAGDMAKRIIDDTVKVRDQCLKRKIPLIFISSSEIYGHSGQLDEYSQKIFPSIYSVRSEYGAAKMLAEMAVVNKARVSDLKYLIIRPFNVAGPRQLPDNGFVLPRFIHAALKNEPLTVYGDGTQRRAFTDVRDIVSAIKYLVCNGDWNSIWNIGEPANEMSIEGLAVYTLNMMKQMGIETTSDIIYVDPKTIHGPLFEEVPDKIPYTEKLKRTGWKRGFGIEKTIKDAVNYILENE
jgi:nucleoside-diphosphate-sugar epimerase